MAPNRMCLGSEIELRSSGCVFSSGRKPGVCLFGECLWPRSGLRQLWIGGSRGRRRLVSGPLRGHPNYSASPPRACARG